MVLTFTYCWIKVRIAQFKVERFQQHFYCFKRLWHFQNVPHIIQAEFDTSIVRNFASFF